MKKTNRTIQTKRPRLTILLLLFMAAIALFLLKNSILNNKKNPADNTNNQPSISQTPAQDPSQSAPEAPTPALPTDQQTTPEPPLATELQPASTQCQQVSEELHLFFKQLDNKKYIQAYALNKPIENALSAIITKALNNPPVNVKETTDLLTVLKNSAHFYRVLGGKDLSLLKDILKNEQPLLEQQFALFYTWSTLEKDCRDNSAIKIQLPLAKAYEYAAFFLNTLGGQSYLFRRDAAVRVLTRYYCLLIINQAAQQSINKYNINIPYHLEAVMKDISSSDFLENQNMYLETLQKLKVHSKP